MKNLILISIGLFARLMFRCGRKDYYLSVTMSRNNKHGSRGKLEFEIPKHDLGWFHVLDIPEAEVKAHEAELAIMYEKDTDADNAATAVETADQLAASIVKIETSVETDDGATQLETVLAVSDSTPDPAVVADSESADMVDIAADASADAVGDVGDAVGDVGDVLVDSPADVNNAVDPPAEVVDENVDPAADPVDDADGDKKMDVPAESFQTGSDRKAGATRRRRREVCAKERRRLPQWVDLFYTGVGMGVCVCVARLCSFCLFFVDCKSFQLLKPR
jgi:hypothetical protein